MIFVTKEICEAVVLEIKRKSDKSLFEDLDAFAKEQIHLFPSLMSFIKAVEADRGAVVAGIMTQLITLMYKLIKTQTEVNELEEQGKL